MDSIEVLQTAKNGQALDFEDDKRAKEQSNLTNSFVRKTVTISPDDEQISVSSRVSSSSESSEEDSDSDSGDMERDEDSVLAPLDQLDLKTKKSIQKIEIFNEQNESIIETPEMKK